MISKTPSIALIAGLAFFLLLLFASCEREVELELPEAEAQLVVEGRIELGSPPIVLLSRSRGFFEPTSLEDFAASYIDDAEVSINGIPLARICSDELPPGLSGLFEEATGFAIEQLGNLRICAYVGTHPDLQGTENTTYHLKVEAMDRFAESIAHLPRAHPPDSVWFRLWANSPDFGLAFVKISDPDTAGNAYRVFTRRIARPGPSLNSNPIDNSFYPPLGAAFIDDFFNGETVELIFLRGQPPNSSRPTDQNEGARFFEIGDLFVFKLCSTTRPVYNFFNTYEAQIGSTGSPFAAPNNVESNVEGALGVWAAYACTCDTVDTAP